MKQLLWIAALVAFVLAGCAGPRPAAGPDYAERPDVLAVIDGRPVTVDEFEQRYARSVGSAAQARDDSMAAYRDFLDRYVDFRLKVLAAREAGYAQDSLMQREIRDYRLNLGRPYLMEESVIEPIVRDLYDRSQEMIDVSHILVRATPDAPPADTLAAYERLAALRDSIVAGADFGEIAMRHSEDPSARMEGRPGYRGHLGWLSAGRVIEAFEREMYRTAPGEVSPVFRTQYGYHVLQVEDRRETPAQRRLSHILIRPEAQTDEARAAALAQTQALRDSIAAGADFGALAVAHSEDPGSAARGGDLGTIGFDAPLVAPFKEAAFEIDAVGDVTEPVETSFGYHLIKLTDVEEQPSYEEAYEDLKQRAQRLPRTQQAETALVERAFARRGVSVDTALVRRVFAPMPADSALQALAGGEPAILPDTVFATLGDSAYTFADLGRFAAAQRPRRTAGDGADVVLGLVEPFMRERALTYEVLALEDEDDEFAAVMREFRDGLLLFRLMEDSVWTAASEDSLGLLRHYEARPDQYRFPERTVIVTLTASDDSLLAALGSRLDAGTPLAALAAELEADSTQQVRLDTTRLAGPTDSIYDRALALDEGQRTEPIRQSGRWVLMLNRGTEAPRAKTFEEARAEVANAYQEVVEQRLLERLRAEYGVRTFPEHLVNVFDQPDATADDAAPLTEAASQ